VTATGEQIFGSELKDADGDDGPPSPTPPSGPAHLKRFAHSGHTYMGRRLVGADNNLASFATVCKRFVLVD
jgi:hypothetical protein